MAHTHTTPSTPQDDRRTRTPLTCKKCEYEYEKKQIVCVRRKIIIESRRHATMYLELNSTQTRFA